MLLPHLSGEPLVTPYILVHGATVEVPHTEGPMLPSLVTATVRSEDKLEQETI